MEVHFSKNLKLTDMGILEHKIEIVCESRENLVVRN